MPNTWYPQNAAAPRRGKTVGNTDISRRVALASFNNGCDSLNCTLLAPSFLLYIHQMFPVRTARLSLSKRLLFKAATQHRFQATATTFQEWRRAATKLNDNMATANKVHLTIEDTGIVSFKPQTAETAAKTSELLQENHDVRCPENSSTQCQYY